MTRCFLFLISYFLLFSSSTRSQDIVKIPRLVAGPVQGHTTASSMKIWLLAKDSKKVTVHLINGTEQYHLEATTDSCVAYDDLAPVTFSFTGLKPATNYEVLVTLNNHEVRDKKMIVASTLSDDQSHDFSFLMGSCAFMPSRFLKPFYPGPMDKIFSVMKRTPADFMLWLGDNLYYRPRHYGSVKGMYKQQVWTRKKNRIDNFMKSMPQYAIWDDHDYGFNDSDGRFLLRDSSLAIHKKFWPNPYYGTGDTEGAFSTFMMYDCEFFLLDNRYYRSPADADTNTILGEKQLSWFLNGLKNSTATFKFVAVGTQVLNESTPHECYSAYAEERKKIFEFIRENKIPGIIFLTGDIHHTVLMRSVKLCSYPIYDFTCSPLTSVVHNVHDYEYTNQGVVKDKIAITHNFGKINITGEPGQRKCLIEVYNSKGVKLWDYEIRQEELQCR